MSRTEFAEGYRLAREAQLERFEACTQGRDRSDKGTPEWDAYFGQGEYVGGGVERLLTYKEWLIGNKRPIEDAPVSVRLVSAETAFLLTGKDLAQLCEAGCTVAAGEVRRRAARKAAKRAGALRTELSRWDFAVSA